jgi:hypothetical protein
MIVRTIQELAYLTILLGNDDLLIKMAIMPHSTKETTNDYTNDYLIPCSQLWKTTELVVRGPQMITISWLTSHSAPNEINYIYQERIFQHSIDADAFYQVISDDNATIYTNKQVSDLTTEVQRLTGNKQTLNKIGFRQ